MTKEWERAVQRGEVEELRRLIAASAADNSPVDSPIDSKDKHGQTALMLAAMKGHTEVVRLLVQNGADLNVTAKYNLSALMLAVINNHTEIVRILVQAGADREILGTGAPGFYKKSALQLAEDAGRSEIAAILRNPAA